jgi:hypothetical protein
MRVKVKFSFSFFCLTDKLTRDGYTDVKLTLTSLAVTLDGYFHNI